MAAYRITLVDVIIVEELENSSITRMEEAKHVVYGWCKDLGCSTRRAHEVVRRWVSEEYFNE